MSPGTDPRSRDLRHCWPRRADGDRSSCGLSRGCHRSGSRRPLAPSCSACSCWGAALPVSPCSWEFRLLAPCTFLSWNGGISSSQRRAGDGGTRGRIGWMALKHLVWSQSDPPCCSQGTAYEQCRDHRLIKAVRRAIGFDYGRSDNCCGRAAEIRR